MFIASVSGAFLVDDDASSLVWDPLFFLGELLAPALLGVPQGAVPTSDWGSGKALVVFLFVFGGIVVASFDDRYYVVLFLLVFLCSVDLDGFSSR